MAEYMDYNDYSYDYKNKKQKRNANIRFIIAVLFLVFVVVWTIVKLPKNVRTDFGPVYSSSHQVGEKVDNKVNEFIKFNSEVKENKIINVDSEFKKNYPQILKLLHSAKLEISKGEIKKFDDGSSFVIARVYTISRQKDAKGEYYDKNQDVVIGETGIDFCIFNYQTKDSFTLNAPIKFSIHYYARQNDIIPYLSKVYVNSSSFRLNYYSLGVKVSAKKDIRLVSAQILLNEIINKAEAENNAFFKKISLKGIKNQKIGSNSKIISGGQLGDNQLKSTFNIIGQEKNLILSLAFDDKMYNKFQAIKIENISGAEYTIVIN